MNGGLPERLDPREAARTGADHTGSLDPVTLLRLAPLVAGFDERVRVRLACTTGADGRAVVEIHAGTRVRVACQRCLEPMVLDLDATGLLGVVADEAEAAVLPDCYEPLELAPGGLVSVAQLAEDELLLALPAYPRHDAGRCAGKAGIGSGRVPGPFAQLKVLKSGADAGPEKE